MILKECELCIDFDQTSQRIIILHEALRFASQIDCVLPADGKDDKHYRLKPPSFKPLSMGGCNPLAKAFRAGLEEKSEFDSASRLD